MKKFYSFFLVAVCLFATSFAYAATRTVYFQKPSQWPDDVYIYLWDNNGDNGWNWNAENKMTRDSETGLYKYDAEDYWVNVIFHSVANTNLQTADLTIADNTVYTCNRISYNSDKPETKSGWVLGTIDQFEFVYFDDFKSNWAAGHETLTNWEPCVYFFGSKNSPDWPGTELVYDETLGYYKGFVVKNESFIFNNGMSNDDAEKNNKQQTGDLTDYNQIYYYGGSFPRDVYALGNIGLKGASKATSWNPDNGEFKLSYLGKGVYEINNIQMFEDGKDGETSYSKFRFHTKLGTWESGDTGTHYRPTEETLLNIGTGTSTTDVTTDGTGDKSWKVVTALTKDSETKADTYYVYDLKLDLFNNELTIDGTKHTTGVESISVEDSAAPVEYFNLQGVRVENPENGLYIVRQGNKVSKQLIR